MEQRLNDPLVWYMAGYDPAKLELVRDLSMWDIVSGVEKLLAQAAERNRAMKKHK